MRCLSFFINKQNWGGGGGIMCRHVPKVPYGSYTPVYIDIVREVYQ